MVRRQPGVDVDGAFADALLHDDAVEKQMSEEMLCAVDVWAEKAELEIEERPGCLLPSPVLYITGHVLAIKGIVLDGKQMELVYPPVEELEDSEESEVGAGRSDGSTPVLAGRGPEVRFRYEFTPAEKVRMAECGIMEPGFELPSILTQNKLETMPLSCRFMTVQPEGEGSMPFVFAEIPSRWCIDTSATECGYKMADYFKESAVMQKFSDMLVPVAEVERAEQAAIEHMEEDLLEAYAAAEIEEDKAKMAEEQAQAEDAGKVLADNEDAVAEKEQPEDAKTDGVDAFEEPAADAWSSVEMDADAVDNIARAFMEGRSVDDAVVREDEDEGSRRQKMQRLRQKGMLDEETASEMRAPSKTAPIPTTSEADEAFGEEVLEDVLGEQLGE